MRFRNRILNSTKEVLPGMYVLISETTIVYLNFHDNCEKSLFKNLSKLKVGFYVMVVCRYQIQKEFCLVLKNSYILWKTFRKKIIRKYKTYFRTISKTYGIFHIHQKLFIGGCNACRLGEIKSPKRAKYFLTFFHNS